MKTRSVLFLLVCLHFTAAAQWNWEDPLPQGHSLLDIETAGGTTIAVGVTGTLLYRIDDTLWERREILPEPNLSLVHIHMLTAEDIWVIATNFGNSQLYHFDGQEWALNTELPTQLTATAWLSPNDGWVAGKGGLIARYDGMAWSPVTSGTDKLLYDISFADPAHGWAVGEQGTLLFYDGSGWTPQPSPTTQNLLAVWMTSAIDGWAIAGNKKLLRYDGSSWLEYPLNLPFQPYSLFFPDENTGWIAGESGQIWKYTGGSWEQENSTGTQTIRSIRMIDENNGYAVGGYEILEKKDGVWENRCKAADFENQHISIEMLSSQEGWVVGQNGMILHKKDGAWQKETSPVANQLWDVVFPSPQEGWIVGNGGTILKYSAGAWQPSPSPVGLDLYEAFFLTPHNGWAVGKSGVILHYDGAQWAPVASPTSQDLFNLHFFDADRGWAVGRNGTILRYLDGVWSLYPFQGANNLNAVVQTGESDGWITGQPNLLLRFDGTDWNPEPPLLPGPTGDIPFITCPEPELCYLLPFNRNFIYRWKNEQWTQILQPGTFFNRRADFISADVGYFLGYNTITRFDAAGLTGTNTPGTETGILPPLVFPNPARGSFFVRLSLAEPADWEFSLVSATGVFRKTLLSEHLDAGEHIREHTPDGVPPGFYFLECRSRATRFVQKITIH